MSQYDDIINLPHKQSGTRPHMAVKDRAAQFAPFAALTGYDSAIAETGRITEEKIELSDDSITRINEKINYLIDHLSTQLTVTVTYFQVDEKKAGGAYLEQTGIIKKIDDYEHIVVMQSGKVIPICDILEITGECFDSLENQ